MVYGFEGRNAHQTLGMLLTRRMEGWVSALSVLLPPIMRWRSGRWSVDDADLAAGLLAADMLGDDLEEWMQESSMMKRCFRTVATIAGLIEKNHPGNERQAAR